ncbi:hypothetical protein [Suipraeoptans intestinalis]|uniref:hypothetical protein n=1 Tax=Suipraeoptans intestinalis TaxID=2606628 RepID=UPI002A75976A|nr:hypothetical protein [Suipraeoptans intestinalis]MDY3121637.1 hypothetical protein [Suipraeoptans intestinalis]
MKTRGLDCCYEKNGFESKGTDLLWNLVCDRASGLVGRVVCLMGSDGSACCGAVFII